MKNFKASSWKRKKRFFAWAFLFLFALTMSGNQSLVLPALAAKPDPPPPKINITQINNYTAPFPPFDCQQNPIYNPVTVSGGGTGYTSVGLIQQYHVQVDWGDGDVDNNLGTFYPSSGQGYFQFIFTGGPHTYTTSGTHIIKARLYHSQPPGNDNQAEAVASLTICIQVEPPQCTDDDGDDYNIEGGDCGPVDCDDTDPDINPGAEEVCNGVDDNCNQEIDEGNPGGGESCDTGEFGMCAEGTTVCQNGEIQCEPIYQSQPEICDNLDNDCDDAIDEDLVQSCYTGPTETQGVGLCHDGTQVCSAGQWDICEGEVTPVAELCDGEDNDCDNDPTDDGADEAWYNEPTSCGVGACESFGNLICQNASQVDTCEPGIPSEEVCDGEDNDCDGENNEGGVCDNALICGYKFNDLINQDGEKDTGEPKISGWTIFLKKLIGDIFSDIDSTMTNQEGDYCFQDLGDGTYQVIEDLQQGWFYSRPFAYQVTLGQTDSISIIFGNYQCLDEDNDSYSGVNKPNNCGPWDCNDGDDTIYPGAPEICDDQKDNNCDGLTDGEDEQSCPPPPVCTDQDSDGFAVEGGECGPVDCNDNPHTGYAINPGATEVCNQVDDDCDDQIDEDGVCWSCTPEETQPCYTGDPATRDVGECHDGIQVCTQEGEWGACTGDQLPVAEICDNKLDDDCDGLTDYQDTEDCQVPVPKGSICGYKFYDDNQDGIFNGEDYGLSKWIIWASGGHLITTPTNGGGYYCFNALEAGTWTIWEEILTGWTPTTPPTTTVELTEDQGIDNINFGNIMCIDEDEDGYAENGGLVCGPTDCDDRPEIGYGVNPGVGEICDDEIDNNCDGLVDGEDTSVCPPLVCTDNDGDGYYAEGGDCGEADCNDNSYSLDNVCITPPGGGGGGGGGGPTPLYIHTENTGSGADIISVVITWFTNRAANSRVVYDTVSHPDLSYPPNYGYQWSTDTYDNDPKVTYHVVTISGLSAGTTYYFRPISAASPEVYGIELTYTTGIVLGEEIPPAEEQLPAAPYCGDGSCNGEETCTTCSEDCGTCPALPGIVLGEEYKEEGEVLAETVEEPEVTVEEEEEGPAVIAPAPTAPPAPEKTNCLVYIWLLLILNLIVALAFWFRGKNQTKPLFKYCWLIQLLLTLVPVIIWYPQCWLVIWLIIILIGAVIYLLVYRQKITPPLQPPSLK